MAKTELDSRDFELAIAALGIGFFYLWALVGFLIALAISFALFIGVIKNHRLMLSVYLITPLLFGVTAAFVIVAVSYGADTEWWEASSLLARRVVGSLIVIVPTSFLYWLFWDGIKIAWMELRHR
jgi:hypothetical protein